MCSSDLDSGTAPPGVPTLLLPPNGFLLPLGTVWLNWTDVAGASSYQVELMLNGTTLSASFVTLSEQTTPALPTGTFAWRVRAIGPGGSGNWTAYHTFSTAAGVTVDPTPPSAPSQYWPLNGLIGRASCRERSEISMRAVPIKKHNTIKAAAPT